MTTSPSMEVLEAHTELWNLIFSYNKSMALECAVSLGLPNAIHQCGGAATLSDLLDTVPMPQSKRAYLPRLMRFLAVSGIFNVDDIPAPAAGEYRGDGEATCIYRLTPLSRLLVDEAAAGDNLQPRASLSAFVLSSTTKYNMMAAMHLSDWLKSDDGTAMPFRMVHGTDMWGVMERDPKLNQVFNAGMASDTQFAMDFIVSNYGDMFKGITSLVDVAGGTGSAARAIAKAFPHIKCSVLDLPNVIESIPADDDVVEYVAGDMMCSIPPAAAVFLKYVLHDWNDEDCVKILTQCKKAIPESGGKVIIMDMVVGSPSSSSAKFEAQVSLDLQMMMITSGKERNEHEWRKVFMDAGFNHYKTRPVLGFMAITELYT